MIPVLLLAVILQGILEMIEAVIGVILDFITDPIGFVCEVARKTWNGFSDLFDIGTYKAPDPELITIEVPTSYIDSMKSKIEQNAIELDRAGIDDLLLKKLVLTSFKGAATNATEVAMLVSDEEYNQLNDELSGDNYYRMKMDDADGNKQKYIATKGIVDVWMNVDDEDDDLKQMIPYTKATYQKIVDEYNKEEERRL